MIIIVTFDMILLYNDGYNTIWPVHDDIYVFMTGLGLDFSSQLNNLTFYFGESTEPNLVVLDSLNSIISRAFYSKCSYDLANFIYIYILWRVMYNKSCVSVNCKVLW